MFLRGRGDPRDLHSFPTRRSSDLAKGDSNQQLKATGSIAVLSFSGYEAGTARFQLRDRKSTRLNSSHLGISYAVFCLKKKSTTSCIELRVRGPPRRTRGIDQSLYP